NSNNVLAESHSTAVTDTQQVHFQHIRNATSKITYGDVTFLIDPMLAKKDSYPGFAGTYRSEIRIPMIDLPFSAEDAIKDVDAVVVTHTHLDHWDDKAQELLPKTITLFVQNKEDQKSIRAKGFEDVRILGEKSFFKGVYMTKTGGQHGTDKMYAIPELANSLGEAMGVVFQSEDYSTVYFVGDTVWKKEVEDTLTKFTPDVVVLNTGDAKLENFEGSIIMGEQDVLRTIDHAPHSQIIAVHMDAVNHAALSRKELRKFVQNEKIADQVLIPNDGEMLQF
ncbi:TPA: MBL fold metallo-hydrolase, partial [Vibrio cholerae]